MAARAKAKAESNTAAAKAKQEADDIIQILCSAGCDEVTT